MRKFLSFLCALTLVLSANATPAKSYLTSPVKQQVVKHALKAPQAKQAHHDVTITKLMINDASGNDFVMFSLLDMENSVEFDIAILRSALNEGELESGITYTLDDMEAYYCYWFDSEWNGADFSEVSFTKTVAEDGSFTIEVEAVDTNGDTFALHYAEDAPAAGEEVIELNFTEPMSTAVYSSEWQDWQFAAVDYTTYLAAALDILSTNSASPAGSYETSDFDLDYTGVYDFNVSSNIIKATEAAAEVAVDANGRIDIVAVLTCTDGNTYRITMFWEPASYDDAKDIIIASFETKNFSSDIEYHLTNAAADTLFVFDIKHDYGVYDIELDHTYTLSDMYSSSSYTYAKFGTTKVGLKSAEFTKTMNEEGLVRIEAFAIDNNDDTWHLIYQEQAIEPVGEPIDIPCTANMTKPQYYSDGSWLLASTNEAADTIVQIYVYGVEASPVGEYNKAVIDLSTYSFLKLNGTYIYFADGTITVTGDAEHYDVVADMISKDAQLYHITMSYDKPAPVEHNITIGEVTTTPQTELGAIRYTLNSEDENYRFFFFIYLDEEQTDVVLAKEYTFADDMMSDTNKSYGMDFGSYSYIDYAEASFIKKHEAGLETIDVTIIDVNGDTWNLHYETVLTSINNTDAAIKAAKVVRNGQLIIIKNGVEYNAQGAVVK